jgi:hypothetical protein
MFSNAYPHKTEERFLLALAWINDLLVTFYIGTHMCQEVSLMSITITNLSSVELTHKYITPAKLKAIVDQLTGEWDLWCEYTLMLDKQRREEHEEYETGDDSLEECDCTDKRTVDGITSCTCHPF